MTLEQEVAALKAELEELRSSFHTFKGNHFTPDNYLRYESLPQLVGGVTHSAGSEEVLAGDRWEYVDPAYGGTAGDGYNLIDPTAGAASATVVDDSAEGKLISVGFLCSGSNSSGWSGGETVDADFRITIDGGTAVNLPLSSGGSPGWDAWALPWATTINGTVGAAPYWGSVTGDTFNLQMNLEYKTSLKLELVINSASGFAVGEDYLWFCYVHRAHLV